MNVDDGCVSYYPEVSNEYAAFVTFPLDSFQSHINLECGVCWWKNLSLIITLKQEVLGPYHSPEQKQ